MLRNCSIISLKSSSGFHFAICTPSTTHYFVSSSREERRYTINCLEKYYVFLVDKILINLS